MYIPWPAWPPPIHHCTHPPRADLIHHIQCTSRGQRGPLPHITVPTLPEQTSSTTFSVPRVTLYTAGHLHTAVPHCWHNRAPTVHTAVPHCSDSRAPIVHTAVPRENNEHGWVYLRCRAVCKLPGCVEGHPSRGQRGPLPHITVPTLPEQTSSTTFSVHPVASVALSHT